MCVLDVPRHAIEPNGTEAREYKTTASSAGGACPPGTAVYDGFVKFELPAPNMDVRHAASVRKRDIWGYM